MICKKISLRTYELNLKRTLWKHKITKDDLDYNILAQFHKAKRRVDISANGD